jgi:hypothetical protein
VFSENELAQYDGTVPGKPIYIAIDVRTLFPPPVFLAPDLAQSVNELITIQIGRRIRRDTRSQELRTRRLI